MEFKPQKHLINILQNTKNHHPNFTILLGAGASYKSGIKISKDLIEQWRTEYKEIHSIGDQELTAKEWYNKPDEYSFLFQTLYDLPSQRREFIEDCIKGKRPSWGYIYLVNLLANKKAAFNTVFTTNFDDLLNDAFHLYSSDNYPMVCAHDSSISSLRITTARPKIIKLHGDFLFDNIKTDSKQDILDNNMKEKFCQYAPEFGLIVVGYSGNDKSIMSILDEVLQKENSYPHGIYWCVNEKENISDNVKKLAEKFPKKFILIEIQGFDELFAEIHESLDLTLQNEFSDPLVALKDRLNNFIAPTEEGLHHIIKRDMKKLTDKLTQGAVKVDNIDASKKVVQAYESNKKEILPNRLIAEAELRSGNITRAQKYIRNQILEAPDMQTINLAFETLAILWDDELSEKVIEVLKTDKTPLELTVINDAAVNFIKAKNYAYAEKLYDIISPYYKPLKNSKLEINYEYFIINYAQIFAHQGKVIPQEIRDNLLEIVKSEYPDINSKIGSYIVLGESDKALNGLKKLSNEGLKRFLNYPIIDLLPENKLIELINTNLDLRKTPNSAHDYAVKFINNNKYDLANAVLDLAEKYKDKNFNMNYYYINKAQIKLYSGKTLTDSEKENIKKLLELEVDNQTKMGFYIVLGRFEEAEKILKTIKNQFVLSWPIVKLLKKTTANAVTTNS